MTVKKNVAHDVVAGLLVLAIAGGTALFMDAQADDVVATHDVATGSHATLALEVKTIETRQEAVDAALVDLARKIESNQGEIISLLKERN